MGSSVFRATLCPASFPPSFQYVGGALLSTVFVLVGQGILVGRSRKRAQVKYPQSEAILLDNLRILGKRFLVYAEAAHAEKSKDAYTFNCAQRKHDRNAWIILTLTKLRITGAHQNTLENIPIVAIT